jgi:translation elongation factor EF-G
MTELLDAVCSADDELGMMFLEEQPITPVELKAGLRRAVIANKIIPMAGGSAFKNKGVQYLIDAVIDYLPGPSTLSRRRGTWSMSLKTSLKPGRTTTASSLLSASNSGPTNLDASCSSVCIPARSQKETRSTIRAPASPSAWAA